MIEVRAVHWYCYRLPTAVTAKAGPRLATYVLAASSSVSYEV